MVTAFWGDEKALRTACLQLVTVCFMSIVFIFELLVYNIVFLALILPDQGKLLWAIIFGVVVNSLWFLAFWSYWSAHFSDPGQVTAHFVDFVHRSGLQTAGPQRTWQPGLVTYHTGWRELRPERAHHCSTTRKCVLRMDHYCPWIGNCIGFNNHKHFILLAIYGILACLLGFITMLPELVYSLFGWSVLTDTSSGDDWDHRIGKSWESWFLLAVALVAITIVALLTLMLSNHLPNLFANRTSIEEVYEGPNPYEFESSWQNATQVFGFFGLDWFLPIPCWRPKGDGMSFAKPHEVLPPNLQPEWLDFSNPHMVEQLWYCRYQPQQQANVHPERSPLLSFLGGSAWGSWHRSSPEQSQYPEEADGSRCSIS